MLRARAHKLALAEQGITVEHGLEHGGDCGIPMVKIKFYFTLAVSMDQINRFNGFTCKSQIIMEYIGVHQLIYCLQFKRNFVLQFDRFRFHSFFSVVFCCTHFLHNSKLHYLFSLAFVAKPLSLSSIGQNVASVKASATNAVGSTGWLVGFVYSSTVHTCSIYFYK